MDLPESVVFEILLRLPVRSLLRFRSVCKDWFAQINSSVFEEKHLAYQIARDDESLILVNVCHYWRDHKMYVGSYFKNYMTCYGDYESFLAGDSKASYSIDMRPAFSKHVNGIVCIIDWDGIIYLLNPALREIRAITEPLSDDDYRRKAVGFGYDDSTKDYILVQILGVDNYCPCGNWGCISTSDIFDEKCVLYHLETDTWMVVEMPAFMMTATSFHIRRYFSETFFRGSIHWCIEEMEDEEEPEPEHNHRILAFNTTNKLFQEIEFPHGWKDHCYKFRPRLYKVDNSSIALVADSEKAVDVWVMKEYGVTESWNKQYSINFLSYMKPLCFSKTNKIFHRTENSNGKKMVCCYDLSKGEVYEHDVWYDISKGEENFQPYSVPCQVVTCYESLVSIKQSSKLKKEKRESYNRHESRSHPFPPHNLLFI